MFNVSDDNFLFKIIDYLNGEDVTLQNNVETVVNAEYANTRELFESTLDQSVFLSPDYIRLRNFLVKWYTAHKVLTRIQDDASKLFFLPEEHVEELMRSFGFPYGEGLASFREKVNFFLSLIDIYTSKGSKGSIEQMLNFFNLPSTYILEHDLMYNEEGELIFRPRLTMNLPYSLRKTIALRDAHFESFTAGDPLWQLTKEEIDEKVKNNQITLPSRTNYFSFRTNFTYESVEVVPLYFFGYITKRYNEWRDDGTLPPQYIDVGFLEFNLSSLELYTGLIYILNNLFNIQGSGEGENIRAYLGDKTYEEYREDFDIQFQIPPYSRDEVDQLREDWYSEFLVSQSEYPFTDSTSAAVILEEMNPTFKQIIDTWDPQTLQANATTFVVKFAEWLRNNLDADLREISVYLFGFRALQELDLNRIINFFKPYRAKLSLSDLEYVMERPLFECIRYDDEMGETRITEYNEDDLYFEELLETSIEQTYTEDPYVLTEEIQQEFLLSPVSSDDISLEDQLSEINLTQIFVDPEFQYDVGYNYDTRIVDDNTYLTINADETNEDNLYSTTIDSAVVNGEYYENIELKDTIQNNYVTILDENLNEKKVATQSVGHYYFYDKEGMYFDEPLVYDNSSEFVTIYSEEVL